MHIFLDYTVIDQLHRIDDISEYREINKQKEGLKKLRSLAEKRKISCYMSDITKIEMLHGREKPDFSAPQVAWYKEKDESKLKIAEKMGVIWLSYPASRLNEHLETKKYPFGYSRLDLTMSFMDTNWEKAYDLERKLLHIKGVSQGDARQIVSMIYGTPRFPGKVFLAEDKPLIDGIKEEIWQGSLNQLTEYFWGSVKEFLSTFENSQK